MSLAKKSAEEIRDTWQSRMLREADGKLQRVILAIIRAEYPGDLLLFLRANFGSIDIPTPFYRGYASITPLGSVICEVVERDARGMVWRGKVKVYDTEDKLNADVRRLADRLKLSDADRIDAFRVLKKWITLDMRMDINNEKQPAA